MPSETRHSEYGRCLMKRIQLFTCLFMVFNQLIFWACMGLDTDDANSKCCRTIAVYSFKYIAGV